MVTNQSRRVPDEVRPALATLVQLSDERIEALVPALQKTSLAPSRLEYTQAVAEAAGLPVEDVGAVIRLLMSLYVAIMNDQGSAAQVAEGVVRSMEATGGDELRPLDGDWNRVRNNLRKLLTADGSVEVLAKAELLRQESERSFLEAQIFTDVRSVFADEPEVRPAAAVVAHNLRIRYFDGSRVQQIFFCLSPKDLEELRGVINRAEAKATSIKAFMSEASVPILEEQSS